MASSSRNPSPLGYNHLFIGLFMTLFVIGLMQATASATSNDETLEFKSDRRSKRSALHSYFWGGKILTYKIFNFPWSMSPDDVKTEIGRAFALWSKETDLVFIPKESEPVHIKIRFLNDVHGDDFNFFLPSEIAHAFYPWQTIYRGQVHFRYFVYWTKDSFVGVNLFQVATHEIGHALGLLHSNSASVMYPHTRPYNPNFKLGSEDVLAIQGLYGKRPTGSSPGNGNLGGGVHPYTTGRPIFTQATEGRSPSTGNAGGGVQPYTTGWQIFTQATEGRSTSTGNAGGGVHPYTTRRPIFTQTTEGRSPSTGNAGSGVRPYTTRRPIFTQATEGRSLSTVNAGGGVHPYTARRPIFTQTTEDRSPSTGIAGGGVRPYTTRRPIFTQTTEGRSPSTGNAGGGVHPYTTRINEICRDPKVDALFNSSDGTYAFKGNKYYQITNYSIANGFPKLISEGWKGLPDDLDAAFNYDGRIFFFKGNKYWVYQGQTMFSKYPRLISVGFPGVPENLDAAVYMNSKIYFYKGGNLWIFDSLTRLATFYRLHYLPKEIDAALVDQNDDILIFRGEKLYKANSMHLEDFETSFSVREFFGCN